MVDSLEASEKSDNELVALTLQNQDNFLYLMKRYEGKLLAYILRLSSVDSEEAKDILQDVFIKTYQNLNSFDQKLKFSSWIYRICHNQVISHYRKAQARPKKYTFDVEDSVLKNLSSDVDMASQADLQLTRQVIDRVLSNLDSRYREILVLRFFEEKDYREISDILKKPMGTVATLLNRAKKAFRQELYNSNHTNHLL